MSQTQAPVAKRRSYSGNFFNNPKIVPYVFVSPFILFLLVVYLYPSIATVLMSFQKINGPTSTEWIGTMNYQRLFTRNYWMALETTTRYTIWNVAILTSVPLLIAVFLKSRYVVASGFFKSLFFVPALTSIIVAGIVFRLAFGSLETALVNRLVILMGLQPQDWLMQKETANFVMITLTLWRWLGVNIVYYYSGLQAIPEDLYEASTIDGANAVQQFIHVTLPGLRPVIIYVLTITVLGGFSMFTESVALWQQNNPGGIGRTIVGYMYMMGFYKNNMGMASAVGLTLLVLVVAANMMQLVLMGFFKKEED